MTAFGPAARSEPAGFVTRGVRPRLAAIGRKHVDVQRNLVRLNDELHPAVAIQDYHRERPVVAQPALAWRLLPVEPHQVAAVLRVHHDEATPRRRDKAGPSEQRAQREPRMLPNREFALPLQLSVSAPVRETPDLGEL